MAHLITMSALLLGIFLTVGFLDVGHSHPFDSDDLTIRAFGTGQSSDSGGNDGRSHSPASGMFPNHEDDEEGAFGGGAGGEEEGEFGGGMSPSGDKHKSSKPAAKHAAKQPSAHSGAHGHAAAPAAAKTARKPSASGQSGTGGKPHSTSRTGRSRSGTSSSSHGGKST